MKKETIRSVMFNIGNTIKEYRKDMNKSLIRSAMPAILLSLLLIAPYLNKAFTIDDPVFLEEARHVLTDPLHPSAFEMVWRFQPERVSQLVPTGPVIAWLLAPSLFAGGSEWSAHIIELVMLWVGILATVSLARRLGLTETWPAAAGLLVVAMPTVLAMTGTAMPDVPAMTVGVMGIERLAAWREERRWSQAVLAALFLGLAPLTRPHLLPLIAVGAVFLYGPQLSIGAMRGRLSLLLPLLAALLVTLAVSFITRDPHPGAGNLVGTAINYSETTITRISGNAIALPIHWMLAMAFGLPWIALRWREMIRKLSVLITGVSGMVITFVCLAFTDFPSYYLSVIGGLGVAVLWDVLADGWCKRDSVQFGLGLWLLIALSAAPYVHMPAKYLVASAPAAALLLVRELASRQGKSPWLIFGVTVSLGISLGLAILRADATLADLGRRMAKELIEPNVAAGRRVWFVGHWGFQWYAEKAGARQVTRTPPYPVPGDFVVVSLMCGGKEVPIPVMEQGHLFVVSVAGNQAPHMVLVDSLEDSSPGGRIMNKWLGVGFYSNLAGYWPWVWSDSLVDRFSVWRVL
jgi:hypothetical protein